MKLTRRRAGLRLRLEPVEAGVLAAVLGELASVLDHSTPGPAGPADPVIARLFPAAYRDDDLAREFRALTEQGLRDDRVERARECVAELAAATGTDLQLDAEAGERWIKVLNDVRLVLGTRLDITEDEPDDDPQAPDFQERALYYWLTALQDALVRALSG